jgi:hypothetical protein
LEQLQEKVLDRFSFFRSTRKHLPEVPAGAHTYGLEEGHAD